MQSFFSFSSGSAQRETVSEGSKGKRWTSLEAVVAAPAGRSGSKLGHSNSTD